MNAIERLFRSAFPGRRFTSGAEDLFKLLPSVRNSTGITSIRNRVSLALEVAGAIEAKRGIPPDTQDPFLENPCLVAEQAIEYRGDETTILASILYSSLRPIPQRGEIPAIKYDGEYLGRIKEEFGPDVEEAVLETLQISEINLLAKPAISETAPGLPHQDEAQRLSYFVDMLEQRIVGIPEQVVGQEDDWLKRGVRGLGVRASAWSKKLQLLIKNNPNRPLTEEEQIQHIRPNLYINIPLLERISALARFAGYDDISRQFSDIANDISFYCLQLADPNRFRAANERIEKHQTQFLKAAGINMPTANTPTRNAIIRKILEEEVLGCLPEELRALCTLECRPRKDPASLYRKFVSKAETGESIHHVDTSDIIALRLIVKHPNPDVYLSLKSIRNNPDVEPEVKTRRLMPAKDHEAELLAAIQAKIIDAFQTVEKRYKNFIDDPLQNGMKEVDLGYRAIHLCLSFNGVPIEVQLVGYAMHYDNTFGLPSHTGYKGKNLSNLSVFGPENLIYNIPRGSTVADFLATLGEDFAFSAAEIVITRSSVFSAPDMSHPLACPLMPGDKISFVINEELSLSPEHRQTVIAACHVPELNEKLFNANQEYPVRGSSSGASNGLNAGLK